MSIKPGEKRKVLSVFLVIVMMLSMCCIGCNVENAKDNTAGQENLFNEKEVPIEFPYVVDDGVLEITSLFQYTGINPDCGNEVGNEIVAIQLKNVSASYLVSSDVVLTMDDGTKIGFEIKDVPAGDSVMAFSVDNAVQSENSVCTEVMAKSVFEDIETVDGLEVSVDGTIMTLTNNSQTELLNVDIYCRDMYDSTYFGGKSYKYTVEKLPAGESTTMIASDCILGAVSVVRTEVNE